MALPSSPLRRRMSLATFAHASFFFGVVALDVLPLASPGDHGTVYPFFQVSTVIGTRTRTSNTPEPTILVTDPSLTAS